MVKRLSSYKKLHTSQIQDFLINLYFQLKQPISFQKSGHFHISLKRKTQEAVLSLRATHFSENKSVV